jgi:hypothetical protein
MKPIVLIAILICISNTANCQLPAKLPCSEASKEFLKLIDTARFYAEKKLYITAKSYYKAAKQIKDINDSCNITNEEAINLDASIAAPATYQTLIENVLDLQDNANFSEAMNKYYVASKYFSQFQIASFGLTHDSLLAFIFTKCKAGFAAWLAQNYFSNKQFDNSLNVYKIMIDKGYDYIALKRTLYDLGVQLALRDKMNTQSENAKQGFEKYTLNKPEYKYLKMGYFFGWNQ